MVPMVIYYPYTIDFTQKPYAVIRKSKCPSARCRVVPFSYQSYHSSAYASVYDSVYHKPV